jgi:hypothetical protein
MWSFWMPRLEISTCCQRFWNRISRSFIYILQRIFSFLFIYQILINMKIFPNNSTQNIHFVYKYCLFRKSTFHTHITLHWFCDRCQVKFIISFYALKWNVENMYRHNNKWDLYMKPSPHNIQFHHFVLKWIYEFFHAHICFLNLNFFWFFSFSFHLQWTD